PSRARPVVRRGWAGRGVRAVVPHEALATIHAPGAVADAGAGDRHRRDACACLAPAATGFRVAVRGGAMSVGFRAVQWNRAKIIYDTILVTAVALFIGVFLLVAYRIDPPKDLPA